MRRLPACLAAVLLSGAWACGPSRSIQSAGPPPISTQGPDHVVVAGAIRWPTGTAPTDDLEVVAFNLGTGRICAREPVGAADRFAFIFTGPSEPIALLLELRNREGFKPPAPMAVLRVGPDSRGRRVGLDLGLESSVVALASFQLVGNSDEKTYWKRDSRRDVAAARLVLRMPGMGDLLPGLANLKGEDSTVTGEGLWRLAARIAYPTGKEADQVMASVQSADGPSTEAVEAAVFSHLLGRLQDDRDRSPASLALEPRARPAVLELARALDRRAEGSTLPTPLPVWTLRDAGPSLSASETGDAGPPAGEPQPKETPLVW